MTTEPDTDVKAAIELLSSTLDEERKRIFEAGSRAMTRQDAKTARSVLDFVEKLDGFQQEVVGLLKRWEELQAENDVATPAVQEIITGDGKLFTAPPPVVVSRNPRSKKLRVTFEDGSVIFDRGNAANTFTSAIEKIGPVRVMQLGLPSNGGQLVDTKRNPNPRYTEHCHPTSDGRYFVDTYSSTEDKKARLEKIAKLLGINLEIEVFDPRKNL